MNNEGEGNKTPVWVKDTPQAETKTDSKYVSPTNSEQAVAAKTEKPISGWQKKFLGIPVWGWVVIGLILVWAGITVGIVASH